MPVVAPAIGELGALVALLVALGLVFIAYLVVKSLFGVANKVVGWVPWVGKKVQAPLHTIEKRLVNGLSAAVTGLEEGVSATWHVLAHTIAWMGHEIAAGAAATWRVWWYVHVKYPVAAIHWTAKQLQHAAVVAKKEAASALRKTTYITKVIEHPLSAPLRAAVTASTRVLTARVHALERWIENTGHAVAHAVAVTLPGQIGHLRGEVGILTREWGNLRRWVRRHERLLGAGAVTAGVWYALRRLGMGYLRCTNVRTVAKRLCGADPSSIESLLAGTLAVVGSISLVTFAKELQDVVDAEANAMRALIRETKG